MRLRCWTRPRRHGGCRWRSPHSRAHGGTHAPSRKRLLGGVVVAGRPSQDAALPIRRSTRRRPPGRFHRFAESSEVARDALRLGDHREQTHAAVASRAGEHVEAERSPQELSPRAIRPSSSDLRDVLRAWRGGRRRAFRRETSGAPTGSTSSTRCAAVAAIEARTHGIEGRSRESVARLSCTTSPGVRTKPRDSWALFAGWSEDLRYVTCVVPLAQAEHLDEIAP